MHDKVLREDDHAQGQQHTSVVEKQRVDKTLAALDVKVFVGNLDVSLLKARPYVNQACLLLVKTVL